MISLSDTQRVALWVQRVKSTASRREGIDHFLAQVATCQDIKECYIESYPDSWNDEKMQGHLDAFHTIRAWANLGQGLSFLEPRDFLSPVPHKNGESAALVEVRKHHMFRMFSEGTAEVRSSIEWLEKTGFVHFSEETYRPHELFVLKDDPRIRVVLLCDGRFRAIILESLFRTDAIYSDNIVQNAASSVWHLLYQQMHGTQRAAFVDKLYNCALREGINSKGFPPRAAPILGLSKEEGRTP